MAVIFAAIGGAIVIGGAMSYEDHSDYSAYSRYSEYNDYAERERRRKDALRAEIQSAKEALTGYKKSTVNPHLENQALIQADAMEVSENAMDQDAKKVLQKKQDREIEKETGELERQIDEITALLKKVRKVREENDA